MEGLHIALVVLYACVVLFSSNIRTLLITAMAILVLWYMLRVTHRCVLTSYEEVNSDLTMPVSTFLSALYMKNADPELAEDFVVGAGVILALFKAWMLIGIREAYGQTYSCLWSGRRAPRS
jgi:hypothetical protein